MQIASAADLPIKLLLLLSPTITTTTVLLLLLLMLLLLLLLLLLILPPPPPPPLPLSKKKVKWTLVQLLRLCMGCMAHRGSRGIALPFIDDGARRG